MNETIEHKIIDDAVALRHQLHARPEISNRETGTATAIVEFVRDHHPDEVITGLGGTGVAAVYRGAAPGPTLLFRSELDALPIDEPNAFSHRSRHAHVSHKCGHDGHMSMVAAIAPLLMRAPLARGRVVLLFQPAEETGEGAAAVRRDPRFGAIAPDYSFAIHNMPGYPLHQVLTRAGTFAMASVGMQTRLAGRSSHASQPELGVSPAFVVAKLLGELPTLGDTSDIDRFRLVTLTHATLGERSFGISPGIATVLATLRAARDEDLHALRARASALATQAAKSAGLGVQIEWSDDFAATTNDAEAVRRILDAASALQLDSLLLPQPFRWSEDFGHFTQISQGAMFGLGAGVDAPALHSPDYDFPDELIATGVSIYRQIIGQLLR